MTNWEAIFTQSPVNQGYYNEQRLPQHHWAWPRGTWFQDDLVQGSPRISLPN